MGQNKSKSLIDMVNEVSTNVLIKHMQNCSSTSLQSQTFTDTGGFYLGFEQSQAAMISQSCIANFKVDNKVIADIANEIQQAAESESVALFDILRFSEAETNLRLKNLVATNISTEMVQSVAISASQEQRFDGYGTVMLFTKQKQSSDIIQKALMGAIASTNLAATIDNETSQEAKVSQSNPLDFFSNIMLYIFIFIAVMFLGFLGIIAYSLFG